MVESASDESERPVWTPSLRPGGVDTVEADDRRGGERRDDVDKKDGESPRRLPGQETCEMGVGLGAGWTRSGEGQVL